MYPPKPDPPVRNTGAVRWYAQGVLGGPTREQESSPTVSILTTSTIVPANPDRVALVFSNNTAQNVFIGISTSVVAANVGIPLEANGGAVTMNINDDWTWITREWIGIANTTPTPIYVLELIADQIIPQGQ